MGNKFLCLESIMEGKNIFQNMKSLFSQPVNELYLCSAISDLNHLNEEFRDLNERSFKSILEAETKTEENNQFCIYFKEFKSIIDKFCNKINELASKSILNIENIVDTYKDDIEDDNIVNSFVPFNMEMTKFKNLEDPEIPKFKVKKIFTKEFDQIGLLMQDLGPIASNEAKIKIIASVYNTLKKDMDEDFLEKCAEKLLDDEEYDKKKSFSEQMYKVFRDEKNAIDISKADVLEAKSVLMNYIRYTEVIRSMANKLIEDFGKVSDAMQNMIFQNKSCTMVIDTETDGVENKEYNLDTYSMNQFNIFMKTKTSQLSQVANMYMVAFSIKLDAIIEFINQNKEVLSKAKDSCCAVKPDPFKDDEIESIDGEEPIEDDQESDDIGDDGEDDIELNPDEDIESNDEPVNDDNSSEKTETPKEADPSIESESYVFEYELFNLENAFRQEMLRETLNDILEADQQQSNNINNTNAMANDNSNKAVDIWRTIVEKLKQIFQKFYDMFIGHVTSRINWLKKHENDIKNANFAQDAKIKKFEIDKIINIKIPDLNYEAMKSNLVNKETFIKNEFLGKYGINKQNDQSFSQALKDHFLPQKEDVVMPSGYKDLMFNFCVNQYKTLVDECQREKNILDKAQSNAKRIAASLNTNNTTNKNNNQDQNNNNANNTGNNTTAKNESRIYNTADELYFNEFDQGAGTKSTKNDLMTYFSVCSSVLSIKMSVAQSAFNEFYRALSSLVNSNDKPQNNTNNQNK